MKDFVVSRIRKTCDSLLERLPFRRRRTQLRSFGDITPSDEEEKTSNVCASILSAFEPNIASLQSLLIWERPPLTALALFILSVVFWVAVSWNRRFISVVAWAVLLIYLYRVWVNKIWPEIRVPPEEGEAQCTDEEWTPVHPNYLSVPELLDHINGICKIVGDFYRTGLKLREVSPGRFCIIGSSFCLILAFVGQAVPGVLLVYFLVLGLCLAPGIALYMTPLHFHESIAAVFVNFYKASDVETDSSRVSNSDFDEFLPENSAAVLRQLSVPTGIKELNTVEEKDEEEEQNSATNELETNGATYDSEESSLYTGLGAFPGVEEVNESDEDDDLALPEDENMLPKITKEKKMEFVSSHFNEDSDTDSDAPFTEGLSFGPAQEPAGQKSAKNVTKEELEKTKVIPSSSDSDEELDDFEILEETELTESTK